jgi:hypothetical protein
MTSFHRNRRIPWRSEWRRTLGIRRWKSSTPFTLSCLVLLLDNNYGMQLCAHALDSAHTFFAVNFQGGVAANCCRQCILRSTPRNHSLCPDHRQIHSLFLHRHHHRDATFFTESELLHRQLHSENCVHRRLGNLQNPAQPRHYLST